MTADLGRTGSALTTISRWCQRCGSRRRAYWQAFSHPQTDETVRVRRTYCGRCGSGGDRQ